MLTFEEFKNDVINGVEELADGKFNIKVVSTLKNNGIRLTGIVASGDGINISPTVYLELYYTGYKEDTETVEEIVKRVYEKLDKESRRGRVSADIEYFMQWDNVKGKVYSKLINAGMNRELLDLVPHRVVMDLAEVYYVKCEHIDELNTGGIIQIYNEHSRQWGVSEDDLNRTAHENMEQDNMLCRSISDIIKEILGIGSNDDNSEDNYLESGIQKMYVITNSGKKYGASELLRTDIFCDIADKLHDDIIILPSSIHEIIIIPAGLGRVEELAELVKEVNDTEVELDEILSYHVYRYDRATKDLSIAA
jgi:hypothetical protein